MRYRLAWLANKVFGVKYALIRDTDGEVLIHKIEYSLWDSTPYVGSRRLPHFLLDNGFVNSERKGCVGKWRLAFQTNAEAVVTALSGKQEVN